MQAFLAKIVDIGDSGYHGQSRTVLAALHASLTASYEDLVGSIFITQLRSVTLAWFLLGDQISPCPCPWFVPDSGRMTTYEFDGDLCVVEQVGAFKDDAKRSLSDLLAHAIVHADDIGRRGRHGQRT